MVWVGRSVPRIEDRPLLTGRGRFAADVGFAKMLHMRLVRSARAHGRIHSIDASPALALAGVAAVWTGADVRDIPPIDFRLTRIEGLAPYRQPILAQGDARYVGWDGGAVVIHDGQCLGSVAVSGLSGEEDLAIAHTGVAAILKTLE